MCIWLSIGIFLTKLGCRSLQQEPLHFHFTSGSADFHIFLILQKIGITFRPVILYITLLHLVRIVWILFKKLSLIFYKNIK